MVGEKIKTQTFLRWTFLSSYKLSREHQLNPRANNIIINPPLLHSGKLARCGKLTFGKVKKNIEIESQRTVK
jgi:hypothetical protein